MTARAGPGGRGRTYYEVLGVAESAGSGELRAAYRAAARTAHPDSGGDAERMRQLNEAWHVLGDAERRAGYDRELRSARQAQRRAAAPDQGATASSQAAPDRSGRGRSDGRAERPEWKAWTDDWDPYDDVERAAAARASWAGGAQAEEGDDGSVTVPLAEVEGWWLLLPPTVLALAVLLFVVGMLFASPTLLVFAGAALFVSTGLFVLVPMRAMVSASRSRTRPREE